MHKEIGKFLGVLVYILMYKKNDRGNSGGDVILSGYHDIPPKRCFKIENFRSKQRQKVPILMLIMA